ncbi:MAG: 3-keto-disaccharide hydrolase [Planctomycetaceae bacterium]
MRSNRCSCVTLLALCLAFATANAQENNSPPESFTALFNGKDLTGWYGTLPTLDLRKRLTYFEAAGAYRANQAEFASHWRAENGELVNDGQGAYATTDREFGDYELWIDYKTVPLADSGIYLRGCPQVQIWDYTKAGGKWNLGADKGSGGLWNNTVGTPGRDPLVLADRTFGEWNRFFIRHVGDRVWVRLNDQLVVDDAVLQFLWDKTRPLPARGPIELQTHGGEIRWRNVFLREIPPDEANAILRGKDPEGFVPLFNGKDLTGWQGATGDYEIVEGVLRCKPGKGGVLFTSEVYEDFVVRLEIKLSPAGNNGLAIRYPGEGDPSSTGMCEVQVLDSENAKYAERIDPRQAHGSAYGMIPAHRGYLRPAGQWNYQQVTVRGSKLKVELNGVTILDGDLSQVTDFLRNDSHPGKERTSGHFGFAGHGDPVEFRNVMILRLKPGA